MEHCLAFMVSRHKHRQMRGWYFAGDILRVVKYRGSLLSLGMLDTLLDVLTLTITLPLLCLPVSPHPAASIWFQTPEVACYKGF